MVGILLVIVLIVGVWGWILRMKVQHQTETITAHAENEARVERHNTQLEMKRSRILEDINSSRPMPELIDAITEMVAFSLDFPFCWCEMSDGVRLGNCSNQYAGTPQYSARYSSSRWRLARNALCGHRDRRTSSTG